MAKSLPDKNKKFELYGIFGYPLAHSLSPAMQEKAFEDIGIHAYYLTLELTPRSAGQAFRELSKTPFSGFNVTVPYKEKIVGYLSGLTPEAKSAGAVNTVYREKGRWKGTNTDIYGFLRSLEKDAGFSVKGKRILLIGAGGAARAAVSGLIQKQASSVTILNRTASKAARLAAFFKKKSGRTTLCSALLDKENFLRVSREADLMINSTSAGLKPGETPVPKDWILPARQIKSRLFFDLIYRPAETSFLKFARLKGHKTLNGTGMLVYQGARAFELWTGHKAPEKLMRAELLAQLAKERK